MIKSWIRRHFFIVFSSLCALLIFIFFVSHIFFGNRSLWKVFDLNYNINTSNNELDKLILNKKDIILEIDLLRGDKIDSDFVSEISQNLLGLIYPNQIVIKIPN